MGPAQDHPRLRGVYHVLRLEPPVGVGIIPACAGFTQPVPRCIGLGRDHPRLRGVYGRGQGDSHVQGGSSPLARGLRSGSPSSICRWRIIPACAGFTSLECPSGLGEADHPRLRGVYGDGRLARPGRFRIIPACAGFTYTRDTNKAYAEDHPRLRGVYRSARSIHGAPGGSSPLARGLLGAQLRSVRRSGIIPACAGFTPGRDGPATPSEDHPRLRGVYTSTTSWWISITGSSPLARGLHHRSAEGPRHRGIIPACAGFTLPH